MASIKISGLTEQTTANDTDLLPVASSTGMAKRMTLANFVTWLRSKFAPAGYGLGGYSQPAHIKTVAELDNFKQNGKFSVRQIAGTLVLEGVAFNELGLEVSMTEELFGTQIVRFLGGGVIRRICDNGVWQPWEWENPPMQLGVEYRTTEKWNGKPVYVMCVSCGALPNATIKHIENTLPTNITAIFVNGFAKSSRESIGIPTGKFDVYIGVNIEWGYVFIETAIDMSEYTESYVTVKYIKN